MESRNAAHSTVQKRRIFAYLNEICVHIWTDADEQQKVPKYKRTPEKIIQSHIARRLVRTALMLLKCTIVLCHFVFQINMDCTRATEWIFKIKLH